MAVDEMIVKWSMDSTNFNDGLTKINKSMSVLQSGFKASDSALKNFGNSTDQLKNKQNFLTKQMELQKAKVETLKDAYDKQVKATGENSNASQNLAIKLNNSIGYYNKLEGELKATNTELETQSSKWNKVAKSLDSMGTKLKTMGNNISDVGKKMSLGITAPLLTIATLSTNAYSALDQTQRKTKIIFGDMASDVQTWAIEHERAFGLGSGTIEKYTGAIADITQGMQMSKEASLNMAKGVVDLGVKLGNWGGTSATLAMEDLQRAISGSHESVEKYGVKLTESTLNQYAMSEGLGDTFSKLTEAEKAQVRYAAILGSSQNAVDYWNSGQRSTAFHITEVKEQVGNISENIGKVLLPVVLDITKKVADFTTNLAQWSSENPKVVESIVKIGGMVAVIGPVLMILGKLTSSIGGALKFVSTLDEKFSKLKITCTGAATNLKKVGTAMMNGAKSAGTLALNIGKSALAFGKQALQAGMTTVKLIAQKVATVATSIATKAMSLAQAALNLVMSLNPITLVIIGITALVAGIVYLWNTSEGFRNFVTDMFSKITSIFQQFDSFLTNVFTTDWTESFGVFGNILNAFFATASGIWESIKQIFSGIIDFVCGVFTGDWSRAWQGVQDIFGGIMNGLGAIIKAPLNAVIGIVNMAIDGINSISVDVPSWLPEWAGGGKSFGMNIPKMNYLYQGGIINQPTMINSNTVVGDSYKGIGKQAEVVAPVATLYKNIRNIVKEEQGSGEVIVYTTNIFNVDGKELKRETVKEVIKTVTRSTNNYRKSKGGVSYA